MPYSPAPERFNSKTMTDLSAMLRDTLHDMLQAVTPEQREMFHRMYNHEGKFSRDVDGLKTLAQIDTAFMQVENTIQGNKASGIAV